MGDANELFMLRPVKVRVRREYKGREWAEIKLMVPSYANEDTIEIIANDYLNSSEGENVEFDDEGDGFDGNTDLFVESIEDDKD